MNTSSKTNKILLIVGVFLIVFILSGLIFYKRESRLNKEELERLMELETKEYERVVFGEEFDFSLINDAELLDEVDDIRFMYLDEKYYVIKSDGVVRCAYNNEDYRYCYIDKNYKIDFATMKIIKSND